ncbi:MAG: ABC transporter ATP-binding protein [Devosia sp.]|nr:ABC transporter ATP-binding protein [Devosia sp.]
MQNDELLQVAGMSAFYGQFRALTEIDFSVAPGEIVAVIGANGAGKSTFLRSLINHAGTATGSVRFHGTEILGKSTAEIINRGIMLVPEGRRLFPSLTVDENLRLGWEVGRRDGMTADEYFSIFPAIAGLRKRPAGALSGGQQQMVAFGRALLASPQLLLCDEISLGLAPLVVDELYAVLPKLRDRGLGIVIVEQDIRRALKVADRFYCLLEGRVSLTGRPGEYTRADVSHAYFGSH